MTFVINTFWNYVGKVKRLAGHRSYKRLLIGGLISALGDRIGFIAFLAAVSSHSHDVLAIGGITISEMLPGIVALPFVSFIVDRMDKRRLLLVADLARGVLYIIAAFAGDLWLFYLLGFTSTSFTMLFEPSRQALEPHYIPDGEITQANGMRMGLMSTVMLVGPAIGGVIAGTVGFQAAFLVNAASFFVSAYMVFDLDAVKENKAERSETVMHEIMGGLRVVRDTIELKYLFIQMAVFSFVIGIQFPLIFVWVNENLHGGATDAGWLFSAIGIGGLIGGAILTSLPKENQPFNARTVRGRRNIAWLAAVDGVVVLFFAPLTTLLPAMGIFVMFGLIGTSFHVAVTAAITELTPDTHRGRVFSLYSAMQGPLIVLSIALGAPLARQYGAESVFYVTGAMEVLVGGAAVMLAGKILKDRNVTA